MGPQRPSTGLTIVYHDLSSLIPCAMGQPLYSSLCVPSWSDSATSPLRLWFPEGGLGPILTTHIYSLLLPQAKRPVRLALAYLWDGTMTEEPAS